MVDPRYLRPPGSSKSGNDKRRAGPQIGGHYRRSQKPSGSASLDNGSMSVYLYFGPQPAEFGDMHEPVFKDGLVDHRHPFPKGHQGHKLGLQIGGISGIGHGLNIGAADSKAIIIVTSSGNIQ